MGTKAVYVVSTHTSYGLLVYLSVVGFYVKNEYQYIWEPGFQNARMFETKREATKNAEAALRNLMMGEASYRIHKYTKKKNGKIEMSKVS